MKNTDISKKLFEKYRSNHQCQDEMLQYPGILLLLSAIKTAEITKDEKLLNTAVDYLRKFPESKKHAYNFSLYEIGGIATAYAFMKGYLPEFKDIIIKYAEATMNAPRDPMGLVKAPFQHDRDLVWIDSIMAVTPFLLYIGLALNEQRYIDEAVFQAMKHYEVLMDNECGLLHQCKNFVSDGTITEDHWGRGNGWGFIALTELVAYLPKDHKNRRDIELLFSRHAHNMRKYQTSHGMWRQEIPFEYAYEESSATALILYGYAVGIQNGLLDRNAYMATLQSGLDGLFTFAVKEDFGTKLCCVGCRCPGFAEDKGTLKAYILTLPEDDNAHSFGPMILAFSESTKCGICDSKKMAQYYYKKEWDT